jgi:hypothetical protein
VSAQAWRWLQVGQGTEILPTLVDLRMVEFLTEEVNCFIEQHTSDRTRSMRSCIPYPEAEAEARKLEKSITPLMMRRREDTQLCLCGHLQLSDRHTSQFMICCDSSCGMPAYYRVQFMLKSIDTFRCIWCCHQLSHVNTILTPGHTDRIGRRKSTCIP